MLLLKGIGRRLISGSVIVTVSWSVSRIARNRKKTRMIAEARFLRATQYFYLASYFKNVPLVENVLTGEEANNVTKTSQTIS